MVSGGLWLVPDQEKALAELLRVCRREVRLLGPFDREQGHYVGRTLAWLMGGFRLLSRIILDRLCEEKRAGWRVKVTMLWGLVSYIRVNRPSPGSPGL